MYLLDIIPDFPHRPVRPVRPIKTLPDTIVNSPDTVKAPAEIPDTVAQPDTVQAVQNWLGGGAGDDTSMLLWGALIVVAALALCLWLARSYRRRLAFTR